MDSKDMVWEKKVIQGCLENNRISQEELYRHFFPIMLGFLKKRVRDEELALEILNTGMLRVFKKIHLFGFKGSFEGWVRRIIYHALADHFKSAKSGVYFLALEEWDEPTKADIHQNFFVEDILKMVDLLPNATQEVFRLYAIEGFTHAEIANQLCISVGTSKWHLSEARKKLKLLFEQQQEFKHYVR
ncbi:MAG: sigma-70 family RNA polymerase sigma factor [Saprospiraceae bacterium]|nr:sigma-70 family RNA polymerase sigma factor [Saprospiraceae bacterium]